MKLTKQDKEQIINEYKNGKKVNDLAKKYKVVPGTIYNLVSAAERLENTSGLPTEVNTDRPFPESPFIAHFKSTIQKLKEENDLLKIMCSELALELRRKNLSENTMISFDKSILR